MLSSHQPFGEIIESSLKSLRILCWDTQNVPTFGSIISFSYNNLTVFALITQMVTESQDTQRTPFAFKKTPAELALQQPQIFAFIQTVCTVSVIWHIQHTNAFESSLTIPTPPPLHTWAHVADDKMYAKAITHRAFLDAIIENVSPDLADDCIIFLASHAAEHKIISYEALFEFVDRYSQELNYSLKRAQRFLKHMEPLLIQLKKG